MHFLFILIPAFTLAYPEQATPEEREVLEARATAMAANDPDRPDVIVQAARACIATAEQTHDDRWRLEAIKLLVEQLDTPAVFARKDEALFVVTRQLTLVDKEPAARTYFKRLILEYPQSKYIPDALLAFGESLYAHAHYAQAGIFYDKVIAYSQASSADFAAYKKGWCAYESSDDRAALTAFVMAASSRNQALAQAAKNDLIYPYARIGNASKAKAFFDRIAKADAAHLLQKLAAQYRKTGKPDECRAISTDCD